MKKQNKLLIFSTILIILTVIFTGCDNASNPSLPSTPAQNGSASYTITKTEGILNGTLETNKITATAGEIIRITATPSIGYMVQTITVIGADNTHVTVNGTGNDRTFTMPAQNVTVYASFTEKTFSITVAECSNGSFSIDKTEAATNQMVCVTVNPNLYYELDTITITDANGNMIPLNSSNMFTMPACSVTISGTFKIVLPLKSPSTINYILISLGADSTATKFIHSEVAPGDEVETYLLSKDDSVFDVYAWRDGTTIYFYAHNFTDCNRKIPLNTDSSEIFRQCSKLQEIELSYFDTSNVTDMSWMFSGCSALTSLDLSGFDTSNATDMSAMFNCCSKLTSLDLSDFNTSNVTNMSGMFYGCSALTSLDLSDFDTSNVTDMTVMFHDCSALTSLNLSDFDTSNVTNIRDMFYGCSALTSLVLSDFDTSNVTDMRRMFYDCSALTSLDLSDFDTSNVTNMSYMFYDCSALTSLNLSDFDTSNVTDMSWMFSDCSALTSLDLSSFDTLKVKNMSRMFLRCSALETIYASSSFDVTSVTDSNIMFSNCSRLIGGARTTFDGWHTNKEYARIDNPPDAPGYFTLKLQN